MISIVLKVVILMLLLGHQICSINEFWYFKESKYKGSQLNKCVDNRTTCFYDLKFTELDKTLSQEMQDLIRSNEGLPTECRSDICLPTKTESRRKGTLHWPESQIGERYIQKCYYSSEDLRYAYRDCLSLENTTVWISFVDGDCPEPPFAEELKKIRAAHERSHLGCLDALFCFQRLTNIQSKHPSHPIFSEDVQFILELFAEMHSICWPMAKHLNPVLERVIFKFLDMLMGPQFQRYWKYKMSHIPGIFMFLKHSLHNDQLQTTNESTAGELKNKDAYLGKNLFLYQEVVKNAILNKTFDLGGNNSVLLQSEWDSREFPLVDISSILFARFDKLGMRLVIYTEEYGRQIGPMIYLQMKILHSWRKVDETLNSYEVVFRGPDIEQIISNDDGIACFANSYDDPDDSEKILDILKWSKKRCHTEVISKSSVNCFCSQLGFVTLFAANKASQLLGRSFRGNEFVQDDGGTDLSEFLGFPYQSETYLAGMILRATSLVALLSTVFTYIFIKKTRKGISTHILLNLCFSLICLLIVLYIAEQRSGIKRECRVYNILRYYLILVSLMWNGIEAHNMYRMLIKVFNSHMRYFVRKAAVVAWGLPLSTVGGILLIDYKAFDGIYKECKFRCTLKPTTVYFAWLIPMSVIIIHNLAVFSLVLKIICRDNSSREGGGHERSDFKSRFVGACTVLVLLGIPWTLSAFGVIDAENNEDLQTFQGIVGVIFITFVSLQGLFIFLFHCLRSPQVREQWRSTISRVTSSRSSSQRNTRSIVISGSGNVLPQKLQSV